MSEEPKITPFALHPDLAAGCHILGRVAEGLILLQKNASLPWFLFVPHTDASQLHELPSEQRALIQRRWDRLAAWVETRFECDRVNVAAIGNIVSQLHLHTIGRWKSDPLWPGVVWGQVLPERTWSDADLESFRKDLASAVELYASTD